MRRFFTWLVRGWLVRPEVGVLESFLLRAFLAVIVVYTLRMPVTFTIEPHPVGILSLLHGMDDSHTWLTWLAEKDAMGNYATFDLWRAVIMVLLAFYVAGVALPLVLPVLAVMHTLPFTLYASQGYPHHGNQIVSLLLVTQAGTVLYSMIAERTLAFGPPAAPLRGRLLWMSVTLIAGTYFISVITKLQESGGMWLWNANYFALDMIKTQRQSWLNRLDPAMADIPSNAMWMIQHPWVGRAVFGSGIFLEAATLFAIGNRFSAFIIGVSLIIMHRCIDALMGGVAFPYNEYLDITFLVGVPFGIAWLLERSLPAPARWGAIIGALGAVPLSWWLFHPGPERIDSFYNYLLALVNCLDIWTAQNWERFWAQSGALWMTGALCAVVGAMVAARWGGGRKVAGV